MKNIFTHLTENVLILVLCVIGLLSLLICSGIFCHWLFLKLYVIFRRTYEPTYKRSDWFMHGYDSAKRHLKYDTNCSSKIIDVSTIFLKSKNYSKSDFDKGWQFAARLHYYSLLRIYRTYK